MNVYDAAHNLARAIKSSDEYKSYKNIHDDLYGDPKIKEMIEDFRNNAMEIQMAQMSGKEVDSSKMEQMKKLEEILMGDPKINEFFQWEMRFGQMMNDVNKILGEVLEIESK